MNKQMEEYRSHLLGQVQNEELLKFDGAWTAYQQAVADDLKQVEAGNQNAAIESISKGGATLTSRNSVEQSLRKLIQINTAEADRLNKEINVACTRSRLIFAVGSVFAVLLAMAIGIILTRGITRPLNRAIEGLIAGADQVASASAQVSSSAQLLAEGTNEQAASLEETSSSLEEMASMTKQNAGNAGQANSLMNEAKNIIGNANNSMSHLIASMEETSKASEETSKIIKTIDEIAFQTNLLALNAAVEAARAGEAGAGFAVVADEVRNLAMRAAEAAKNTADLIDGTVKKVKDGSTLVVKTNEAFSEVTKSAVKVGELVAEIAAASNEQSQGIEQVSKAMAEMDKVVQQNSSGAEESASAAEEMNIQAEQMKTFVADLMSLVAGSRNERVKNTVALVPHQSSHKGSHKAFTHDLKRKEAQSKELTVRNAEQLRLEKLIPLDEHALKDF